MNGLKKKHVIIPIFIPHKGCPFDCIYCNQKTISGQMEEMNTEKMRHIIKEHLKTVSKDTFVEVGFYGGSFTGITKTQQLDFLTGVQPFLKDGRVKEVRLSTRPDYINEDILDYLKDYGVKTIELGVQSLDEEVLVKSCRGHSVHHVEEACRLIRQKGFNLGIQTMVGLPGATKEKDIETADKVISLKPGIVRIYPTLVIKGTYLEKLYHLGSYKPLSLEAAVEICAELLYLYEKDNINVIRIGLQPTENIREDSDVIAGPFHPAFRQLVESRLMRNRIVDCIYSKSLTGAKAIEISTEGKNISNVVGQHRGNISHLKNLFGFSRVIIKGKEETENVIEVNEVKDF